MIAALVPQLAHSRAGKPSCSMLRLPGGRRPTSAARIRRGRRSLLRRTWRVVLSCGVFGGLLALLVVLPVAVAQDPDEQKDRQAPHTRHAPHIRAAGHPQWTFVTPAKHAAMQENMRKQRQQKMRAH